MKYILHLQIVLLNPIHYQEKISHLNTRSNDRLSMDFNYFIPLNNLHEMYHSIHIIDTNWRWGRRRKNQARNNINK